MAAPPPPAPSHGGVPSPTCPPMVAATGMAARDPALRHLLLPPPAPSHGAVGGRGRDASSRGLGAESIGGGSGLEAGTSSNGASGGGAPTHGGGRGIKAGTSGDGASGGGAPSHGGGRGLGAGSSGGGATGSGAFSRGRDPNQYKDMTDMLNM
ncbi:acanthoscurrin-2-like [Panicum virgatum]|uniref:acanthoscurrin-2-like n=1 Tax=Panicum virgatum TaxID=38727 RepID=UPI0019D5E04C|nr:acanthoscurrin-2-like [Panicum virgatum]